MTSAAAATTSRRSCAPAGCARCRRRSCARASAASTDQRQSRSASSTASTNKRAIMKRDLMTTTGFLSAALVAVGALGACASQARDGYQDPEQAELQALLRDEPLNQVPPGVSDTARTQAIAPPDAGVPPADAPVGIPVDGGMGTPPSDAGTGSGGGSGGDGGVPPQLGSVNEWSFDDCSPSRANLSDRNNFNVAF